MPVNSNGANWPSVQKHENEGNAMLQELCRTSFFEACKDRFLTDVLVAHEMIEEG